MDTARAFSAGAVEEQAYLRHPMGWPTYQEGRAGEYFYRVDPDGYARFTTDPRFGPDGWEVTCVAWPEVACAARRGAVTLQLRGDDVPQLTIAGALAGDEFVAAGDGSARPLPLEQLELGAPRELLAAPALVSTRTGERHPIDGAAIVLAYIAWVESGQADDRGFVAAAAPEPAVTVEPSAGPAAAAPAVPEPEDTPGKLAAIEGSGAQIAEAPKVSPGPAAEPAGTENAPELSSIVEPAAIPSAVGPPLSVAANATMPTGSGGGDATTSASGLPAALGMAPTPSANRSAVPQTLRAASAATARMPKPPRSTTPAAGPQAASSAGACPVPTAGKIVTPVLSLRGLPGVLLITSYMAEPPALKGRLRSEVRKVAEQRFRDAGIRLLADDEVKQVPGQPRLELYLTIGDPQHGCPSRVWLSLRQEVFLARDPAVHMVSGTWGAGGVVGATATDPEVATFTRYLDKFIDDFERANSPEMAHDSAVADTALLARKKQHRKPVAAPPPQTWAEKLVGAVGITTAFTTGLKGAQDNISSDNGGVGQDNAAPTTPSFSTTLSVNSWPGLYGRLSVYRYLYPSRQEDWNPDFAYAFGYEKPEDRTFTLGYSNYGGNRFDPGSGQSHTRFNQGSVRLAYKIRVLDQLVAPWFTDEEIKLSCAPAVSTTPTYYDQASGDLHNFKTALSFGCRYPIWRKLYFGATAMVYPLREQQQVWDPDYIYSFGWSNWNEGTFSLDYSNYSGNRWPWRDRAPDSGRFIDGSVTLSYRVPLRWLFGSGPSP